MKTPLRPGDMCYLNSHGYKQMVLCLASSKIDPSSEADFHYVYTLLRWDFHKSTIPKLETIQRDTTAFMRWVDMHNT